MKIIDEAKCETRLYDNESIPRIPTIYNVEMYKIYDCL